MNSTVKEILPLLDYVKIGSYKEHLGGLVSTTTNQKMFKVNNKQQPRRYYKSFFGKKEQNNMVNNVRVYGLEEAVRA